MSYGQVTSVTQPAVIRGEIQDGENMQFRAYIVNGDGTVPTVATAAIGLKVFVVGNSTAYYTTTSVSGATLGPLSTTGWTKGGDGYNFYAPVSQTDVKTEGGLTYRFEFSVPVAQGTAYVIFECYCRGIGSA